MLLDRSNATASERTRWLDLMLYSPPKSDVSLIYFSANIEVCTSRVEDRTEHETLPQGRGRRIVSEMANRLEPPTAARKKAIRLMIHVVYTFDDAINEALRCFEA